MSSTTPNIGLTKTTAAETIGQNWAASNDSGGNFDIIDTKMGAVGNTSLQAQVTALNSNIVHVATYSFSQTINATTEVSFTVLRTNLNLPTNAVVVDGYIRQNSSSSTNNTWAYSFQIAPTSNTAITGRIYNPTNSSRSYAIMCVVFYTVP